MALSRAADALVANRSKCRWTQTQPRACTKLPLHGRGRRTLDRRHAVVGELTCELSHGPVAASSTHLALCSVSAWLALSASVADCCVASCSCEKSSSGGSYQFGTFPLKKSISWYNRGDTLGIWSDTPCSSNMCTVYYYCADKYSTTRCSIASYSLMTHSCSSDTAYQCADTCAATGPFT